MTQDPLGAPLGQPALGYPSLASLRARHAELLQRCRGDDGAPPARAISAIAPGTIADITAFVTAGRATGSALDDEHDRDVAQGLLDYWSAILIREGLEPPDATLADFDPGLAPELPDAACPYVGLAAFDEAQSRLFFGRQQLAETVLQKLREQRLASVVGPSGSGKSSLVLACVIPLLKAGALEGSSSWRYLPRMVPGSNPLANLARLLAAAASEGGGPQPAPTAGAAWADEQVQRLLEDPAHLVKLADATGSTPLVIVVDQFEELFTLCRDAAVRAAFVAGLVRLVGEPGLRHTAILTMRSDFDSYIAQLPALQPPYECGKVTVTALSAAELREAIEKPADMIGLKYESGLVEQLAQDVLGEPAGLPLLQFTLLQLWDARVRNRIGWETYQEVSGTRQGGARQVLARSADAFYASLLPEEQVTAQRIFAKLVRPAEGGLEFTSKRVPRQVLYQGGEASYRIDHVLDKLIAARLVRVSQGDTSADVQVEVAHEALVRNWPRLVDWLEAEREQIRARQRLADAAQQWLARERDPSVLWRGAVLVEAGEVPDLSEAEREFVHAGLAAEERERAERERRRTELEVARQVADTTAKINHRLVWLTRGLLVVTLAAVLLALGAYLQWQRANETGQAARTNELAALAQSYVTARPARAALYALEALTSTVAEAGSAPPRVQQALYAALASIGGRVLAQNSDPLLLTTSESTPSIPALPASPDHRWLVAVDSLGRAHLWDMQSPDPAVSDRLLGGHAAAVSAAAFSGDGKWLATGDEEGQILLRAISESGAGGEAQVLAGDEDPISDIEFSSGGHWLAAAYNGGEAMLWRLGDSTAPGILLDGHSNGVYTTFFDAEERWLVTGDWSENVFLWDLAAGDIHSSVRRLVVGNSSAGIWSGHLDRNDNWFITVPGDANPNSAARTLHRFPPPASGGEVLVPLPEDVSTSVFSVDNRWLYTSGIEQRLWDLQASDVLSSSVVLTDTPVYSGMGAVFSPRSTWLATTNDDDSILLWPVGAAAQKEPLRLPAARDHGSWRGVAFSPDERWLVARTGDGSVFVWDTAAGDVPGSLRRLPGRADWFSMAHINADGRWLVTGDADGVIRLWNLAGHAAMLANSRQAVLKWAAWNDQGDWLAAVDDRGDAYAYRLEKGDPLATAPFYLAQAGEDGGADVSPDGRWLVVGDKSGNVALWSIVGEVPAAAGHLQGDLWFGMYGSSFSTDGRWISTRADNDDTLLWDLAADDPAATGILLPGSAWLVAPDGRWAAGLAADDTGQAIYRRDLTEKQAQPEWLGTANGAWLMISSDNRWLIALDEANRFQLWDIDAANPVSTSVVLSGTVSAFYPFWKAGRQPVRWLVTAEENRSWLWDLEAESPLASGLELKQNHTEQVVQSKNGRWLALVDSMDGVLLWDLTQGSPQSEPTRKLAASDTLFVEVEFSPDNRWLVTADYNGAVWLWDLTGARTAQRIILPGHDEQIINLIFSPDSRWLLTMDDTGKTQLWDLSRKVPEDSAVDLQGQGPDSWNTSAQFSRDGKWLLLFDWSSGILTVWPLDQRALAVAACRATGRNMTVEEWRDDLDRPLGDYRTTCPGAPVSGSLVRLLLGDALRNVRMGEFGTGARQFTQAREIEPMLAELPWYWQGFCRAGALAGGGAEIIPACDKAVALAPTNGPIRESRAIARALRHELAGAIADLEVSLRWAEQEHRAEMAARNKAWLAALRTGGMPFTAEVLADLGP